MRSAAAAVFPVAIALGCLAVSLVPGCGDYGTVTLASQDAGDLNDIRARGVGEACGDTVRCRTGLACKDAKCAPARALDSGAACLISAECKEGLYCNPTRVCAPSDSNTIARRPARGHDATLQGWFMTCPRDQ